MNAFVLSILLAVVPSLAVVVVLIIRGGSRTNLIVAFIAGYFAVIPALFAELVISPMISLRSSVVGALVRAFLIAGLFEEGAKLLLIRRLLPESTKNGLPEGLRAALYIAAASAAGFAAFENVMFAAGDTRIALIRGVTAVPLHVSATVVMAWLLVRRYSLQPRGNLPALAAALLLHGVYNTLLFLPGPISYAAIPYTVVLVIVLFRMFAIARKLEGGRTTGSS